MSAGGRRYLLTVACVVWSSSGFAQSVTRELRGPEGLEQRIVDGALQLGLRDAVHLVLLNSTDVRVSYLDFDQARYAKSGARQGFDPLHHTRVNGRVRSAEPPESVTDDLIRNHRIPLPTGHIHECLCHDDLRKGCHDNRPAEILAYLTQLLDDRAFEVG